ncbi:hypothetical protein MKX01_018087 [Papaver californicum]|nr:hypothetical protein MKX01_018087 [Papaver californicum]
MSSMPPNKEWMNAPCMSPQYIKGVASFIKFTKDNSGENDVNHCPCRKCQNYKRKEIPLKDIHGYLLENRVDKSYRSWIHHGEPPTTASNVSSVGQVPNSSTSNVCGEVFGRRMVDMFNDLVPGSVDLNNKLDECFNDTNLEGGINVENDPSINIYYKTRLDDSLQPLYPSCGSQHTKLSATVEMLSMKERHNHSDAFFD